MYVYTMSISYADKFVGQVRGGFGGHIVYETPEYLTKEMAIADAKCWQAFSGHVEIEAMLVSLARFTRVSE
jgi:hypothetical protein